MGKREVSKIDNLRPSYHRYKYQKCFIGHSHSASWSSTLVEVCDEVLPTFGLHPWYADAHFDPTTSLRDKVVEMVANTRYGIYDLSYWRRDEQSQWIMPRNVLIELGMAIALNRPILLLRHASNQVAGLALPDSLQSVGAAFCEFAGGKKSLREALNTHLPQWVERSPEREWRNRYCLFGGFVCDYRGSHPLSPLVEQNTIACHIADGQEDIDRDDFRASVEDIIERFDAVSYHYLDDCTPSQGYNFLLCAHCQLVRSTPFAIYRLTSHTPAETFIAIGISIALETQFKYKIPKILLTETLDYVPSLLRGYEVVVGRNEQEMRARLTQFLPQVIQRVQETTWKPQALPFEVCLPAKDASSIPESGVEFENRTPANLEQSEKYDFSIIYSSDGQEWVAWLRWVLKSSGFSIAPQPESLRFALNEALITANEQARNTLLVLSHNMAERLSRTEALDTESSRDRIIAVQTKSERVRLQPRVAKNLNMIELATLDEQVARQTLLSHIGDKVAQLSSMPEATRRIATSSGEAVDQKPHFPGMLAQREPKGIDVFIAYAHEDRALLDKFTAHLSNLRRQNIINPWFDGDISLGTTWGSDLTNHLEKAQIILLLVSASFINSDFCYGIEMMRAMERHAANEARVIPIILRPVDWKGAPFAALQALPSEAKPVTEWSDTDEAFTNVVRGIRRATEDPDAK